MDLLAAKGLSNACVISVAAAAEADQRCSQRTTNPCSTEPVALVVSIAQSDCTVQGQLPQTAVEVRGLTTPGFHHTTVELYGSGRGYQPCLDR
ncbi:hypothetical protein MB84_30890 (plasmid) [Pandoraea oxalativorans]|uniref:Uncharacterized protein n=1 Tax=Pandoraea oxalativorans TaxID=573737 RepID=A0A0G3IGY8_9BURK|nr:hypothetical protein MB84_30890 [Pandoraea oxalativorans]